MSGLFDRHGQQANDQLGTTLNLVESVASSELISLILIEHK